MYYLKDIVTGQYAALKKRRGKVRVEYRDRPDNATFWSAVDIAGYALDRLEKSGAIPPMTLAIVREEI